MKLLHIGPFETLKVRGGVYTCAHQGTSRQAALSVDGERHAPSHQHDYLQ